MKRKAEHGEMMSEHARLYEESKGKRQRFLRPDTQPRKFQIPQVDDHMALKNDRHEIQHKVKEYEAISRKIDDNRETIKRLFQKMESLTKELTDSRVNTQKHAFKIQIQYEEIQRTWNKFNASENVNNILELLDNIEDLHENIEKWAERFQRLKNTFITWKQKNGSLEDAAKKLIENASLRDHKASDIEKHARFVNLMLEVERKITEHKENISMCNISNNLRKQQKEELSTRLWAHMQKIGDQQTRSMTAFKRAKKDLDKSKGRNINFDNSNIKRCIEDLDRKVKHIEELRGRIEKIRNEISESEQILEAWDLEIEPKCDEISLPEITNFNKEHMTELNDLSTKLDRWKAEYKCYEAEHDKWLKKKNQLEEKMKTVEGEVAKQDEQTTSVDESISCLNRKIDIGENMVELRKMIAKLIDLDKQKKDIDNTWEGYEEITEKDKRNAEELDDIRRCLSITKKILFFYPEAWNEIENSSDKEVMDIKNSLDNLDLILWSPVGELINSDLSRIEDFITKTDKLMKTLDFNFELMGPSNLTIYNEKKRIEQWAAQIEEKYEETKQKNEKLSGDNNATHIKGYMDKLEHLFQEISSCKKDLTKVVSAWEKEKDVLEKNTKVLDDMINSQYEFNKNIKIRGNCIKFMISHEEIMAEYKKIIMNCENQRTEANTRWNNYMSEYGQYIDRISNNKDKLIETLNSLCRRQEMNQLCDYTDVEDVFRTISMLTENAQKIMGVRIALVQTFIKPLNSFFWTRHKHAIRPFNPTKEEIEMKLEDIGFFLVTKYWYKEKMDIEEEFIRNLEVNMNSLEENAKLSALNPFNIQIDGFLQVKDECLKMMGQQEAKTRAHDIKWSKYVRDNKEYIEKLDQINKWMHLMPQDALKLFKNIQGSAQDIVDWTGELTDINEKINRGQKEADAMDQKMKDLRSKMADIESMTENPRIFAIESMTAENLTHVFSEMEKWNEMHVSLKEAITHWEDKKTEIEESMTQWETIVHEKYDGKLKDPSMLSVI